MMRECSRGADSQFKLSDAEKAEANALVAKTADELKAMYVRFRLHRASCPQQNRELTRCRSYEELLNQEKELDAKLAAA